MYNETTVMVSGSRSIRQLPAAAINSINKIIAQDFYILVGDAPGVDQQVIRYLEKVNYTKCVVFYSARYGCRTKTTFRTQSISGSFVDRDKHMSTLATYGLAIWDGRSIGTSNNIKRVPKTRVIKQETSS